MCSSSFQISHQGKRDVVRHIDGNEHKRLVKAAGGCKPVSTYFIQDKAQDSVTNAEVLYTGYILEHNLPFEAAAHAGPLFRKMFPDSEIAKKYGCAATKTAAIVNYAMAPEFHNPLVDYLQHGPFSVAIDVVIQALKACTHLL